MSLEWLRKIFFGKEVIKIGVDYYEVRSPEHKEHLLQRQKEEDIRIMLKEKYGLELPSIYLGGLVIHWEKFEDIVISLPKDMPKDEVIDTVYYLMMEAARRIRQYSSSSPSLDNRWSEQTFNQINSVVSELEKRLKPIVKMYKTEKEIKTAFLNEYQEIKKHYQAYCTSEDSYYNKLLENIEKPLKEVFTYSEERK